MSIFFYFQQLFEACRRQTPRGYIESDGSIGKVSVRRVFKYLQIVTGPRRSPPACSAILKQTRSVEADDNGCSELHRRAAVPNPCPTVSTAAERRACVAGGPLPDIGVLNR